MAHLRPALGPCPCRSCRKPVTVYQVWYGRHPVPIYVVHDDDGKHRCRT